MHPGEHEGIVDQAVWRKTQTLLRSNYHSSNAEIRNKFGALLKGLLRCKACGCAMSPSHCTKGSKRYRYYVCTNAQKRGWHSCPNKSVPAGEIERAVVDQIKRIANHRHRSRAGMRIGDGRYVDLLRYTAWLVQERHAAPPARRERVSFAELQRRRR